MKILTNDPAKAGQLAARRITFGDSSRYAVAPIHTRFDAVQWFVWDAEQQDPDTGGPAVVRQTPTLAEAVDGFAVSLRAINALRRTFGVWSR